MYIILVILANISFDVGNLLAKFWFASSNIYALVGAFALYAIGVVLGFFALQTAPMTYIAVAMAAISIIVMVGLDVIFFNFQLSLNSIIGIVLVIIGMTIVVK